MREAEPRAALSADLGYRRFTVIVASFTVVPRMLGDVMVEVTVPVPVEAPCTSKV
ncbi:MAG: hypothetical protein U0R72_11555 [Nakamurella multipartita]